MALYTTAMILLLMTLGFAAIVKVSATDTLTSGALTWHAKSKDAADFGLNSLVSTVAELSEGRALEFSVSLPAWYRTESGADPDAAYWAACFGNTNTTLRCDRITVGAFNVYRLIQPTTLLASDTGNACNPFYAVYYKIFIHAEESSGKGSSSDTESIFRVCIKPGN